MSDTAEHQAFSLLDAPMAYDRTAGWAYFRKHGEVFGADGIYFLTSAAAVQYAMQHPELFSSAQAFGMMGSPVPLIPLAVDPPDHVRYRRVLDPMLAPRVVNAMEDELRRQVGELIDAFAGTGRCEAMTQLARLYPTQVFLTLFGLPLEDRDRFMGWVRILNDDVAITGGEENARHAQAAGDLFAYLQSFIERKRAQPSDDMLSRILALRGDSAWTDQELLGLCFLFTLAGLDTVTGSIGFVLYHLARDAELRHRVVADPSLVPPVVEEIIRLEMQPPLEPRVTTQDVVVCGTPIPKGTMVQLATAAANRDPARFPSPNDIDLDHADQGSFTFGGGIHRCVGSHLARRELRLVLEEFHKRIPDYEIEPGAQPRVHWPAGTLMLESLPLVFATR